MKPDGLISIHVSAGELIDVPSVHKRFSGDTVRNFEIPTVPYLSLGRATDERERLKPSTGRIGYGISLAIKSNFEEAAKRAGVNLVWILRIDRH